MKVTKSKEDALKLCLPGTLVQGVLKGKGSRPTLAQSCCSAGQARVWVRVAGAALDEVTWLGPERHTGGTMDCTVGRHGLRV